MVTLKSLGFCYTFNASFAQEWFLTSYHGHSENIVLMSYADLPDVDTSYTKVFNCMH